MIYFLIFFFFRWWNCLTFQYRVNALEPISTDVPIESWGSSASCGFCLGKILLWEGDRRWDDNIAVALMGLKPNHMIVSDCHEFWYHMIVCLQFSWMLIYIWPSFWNTCSRKFMYGSFKSYRKVSVRLKSCFEIQDLWELQDVSIFTSNASHWQVSINGLVFSTGSVRWESSWQWNFCLNFIGHVHFSQNCSLLKICDRSYFHM